MSRISAAFAFAAALGFGSVFAQTYEKVDATMGAPLGGIGAGAIKFCATNGNFYYSHKTPLIEENFPQLANTALQFFSSRGGTVLTAIKLTAFLSGGKYDDDAIFPCHFANFGTINGVSIRLTAFAPFNLANADQMSYPYALYEISMTNSQATSVDVAAALQIGTTSAAQYVAGKGIAAADHAVYASSGAAGAIISAGNDNGFMTAGQCNNTVSGTINRVACKMTLGANATQSARFVLSWYNSADPAHYFYANAFTNAGDAADYGLARFDSLKTNAVTFVTRMRGSNVPSWFVNYTTNLLSSAVNNCMYTKDGRFAWWEGHTFQISGTLDQSWHSKQMLTMFTPSLVWKEMEYWSRTQKTNPAGQIHHDFASPATGGRTFLVAWDDQQHYDYAGIDNWVDLNCGYLINIWETYCATGDETKFDYFWPYMKKAGQRILNQVTSMGNSTYPYTFNGSGSTYDIGGNSDVYNAGLTAAAYKIMALCAQKKGETALAATYTAAFTTVNNSFTQRYLTNNFPMSGSVLENPVAGQWISFCLKFGELYPTDKITYAVNSLITIFKPITDGCLGSWSWEPYIMGHLGGILLTTGKTAEWRAVQNDFFHINYDDRSKVFNQDHDPKGHMTAYPATDPKVDNSYCSIPVTWRNYYSLIGYHRNKGTGELWIEPMLPAEMNHVMTNALYVSPEGMGAISYAETGTSFEKQDITFKPDNPITVSSIYVRDKGIANTVVTVGAAQPAFTRIGTGYAKELKIAWAGTIQPSGLRIAISDVPVVGAMPAVVTDRAPAAATVLYDPASRAVIVRAPAACAAELFGANGMLLAASRSLTGGEIRIAAPALKAGGFAVVRLTTQQTTVIRRVAVMR